MVDREFKGRWGDDDPPSDSSNTIITEDSMEAIVAISEGPIRGLVDGPKSFSIGDTPLQAPDGSLNYKNFTLGVFNGYGETITSAQGGFGSATGVSVELLTNQPVTRTINTLGIDYIDIRMVINRLYVDDEEGKVYATIANLVCEWRADNDAGWHAMDAAGGNPQVSAEGYTVYGGSYLDRGPPAYWQNPIPNPNELAVGVWFSPGSSNIPLIINSHAWVAAIDTQNVPEGPSNLPYWTWKYFNEDGTVLRARAWIGPSTYGHMLLGPNHGGYPRAGDFWLQTDIGQLKYFNGNHWLTANTNNPSTVYPIGEYVGTGAISVYQRIISSPVVWQFRFPVPRLQVPIQVRIRKTSFSTHDDYPHYFSDITWESAIAHIARRFQYQNLAIAQINAQASGNFSSIPDFSGIYYGRIIKVPSNYDATNKTYAGAWDGMWKMEWTDNPAFIVKDLVENSTYGMGMFYHVTLNDWDVYDAGQWCDTRVLDGHPRFTFNGIIAEPRIGKEAIDYVCGIFSGRFVDDGNGFARILIDRSDTPAVQLFTKENVELGAFNYSFSDPTTRYNDLTIAFTNPELNWLTDRRRLYWQTAMDDFGRVPYNFVAVGCIYAHEAYLRGRYVIATSQTEKLIVQFKTSRNGLTLNPYDIVLVADELIHGRPPNANDLPGYFIRTSGDFVPLLAADTNQPLFISEYDLPEATAVFDKFKTGRTVLNQNSNLADISAGVTLTQSILTTTDARTVLLRDPVYLESGLAYMITFQTLTGTAEYQVDPTWTGIKYDIKVTTDITQALPEKAVFSLRVVELTKLPKPFRVLTIAPTDSDDIVEVTGVEVNRTKWTYVDQTQFLAPTSFIFALDASGSMNGSRFATVKAVMNSVLTRIDELRQRNNPRVDICVCFWSWGAHELRKTAVTSADIAELIAFVNAEPIGGGTNFVDAANRIKSWFDATRTDTGLERRIGVFLTDGEPNDSPASARDIIADILDPLAGVYSIANNNTVSMYGVNIELTNTSSTAYLDNTPGDGVPVVSGSDSSPLLSLLNSLLTSPVRILDDY